MSTWSSSAAASSPSLGRAARANRRCSAYWRGWCEPDTGEVSVFGEAPVEASRSKHLGWVPQSPALLPWRTVLENVRLPLEVNKRARCEERDPEDILARLGLGQAKSMLPAHLSGGMRQRVAIARAFAFAPALLLMDEPFGALDEMTREHVAHLLLELWQAERPTVVFVTHSVNEAVVLSDRVVVMGEGKLTAPVDITLPRPRPEGDRGHRPVPRAHGRAALPPEASLHCHAAPEALRPDIWAPPVVAFGLLLLIWELLAAHDRFLLPTIGSVVNQLVADPTTYLSNAGYTLSEAIPGVAISYVIALVLAWP